MKSANAKCAVCDSPAHIFMGGVAICRACDPAVREEMETLRSANKPVDVARIAYRLRAPDSAPQFLPSADAVNNFLRKHEITGNQAARMMYLSGSRQVRKYTGGEKPRQMDGARWFALHAHMLLTPDQIKKIETAMSENLSAD